MAQLSYIIHVISGLTLQPFEELPITVVPDPSSAHSLREEGKPLLRAQVTAQAF